MTQGKIVQIIGAVVDVEFARTDVPKIYDALKVDGTAITQLLLHFQRDVGALHLQRVVHLRHALAREFDVDDGADDLDDLALVAHG